MFTRNYYNTLGYILNNVSSKLTTRSGSTITVGVESIVTNVYNGLSVPKQQYANYNGYCHVMFGTGTTPATINDYKFSGTLITGCSISVSVARETNNEEGYAEVTALYTITNNNSDDITIGEIGVFFYKQAGSVDVLVERTVLETPITIEPGGVGQVTYSIRMNYPTV